MNPPYLTPRAKALMPQMANKVRELLDKVSADGADKSRIPKSDAFAMKLLGCAVSPTLDPNDEAFREVMAHIEAGAFSPDERRFFERELPRMTGIADRILRPDTSEGLSPADIRAIVFAIFANARNEEGTMGENLHIGARRVFERYYELFSGLQSVANRSGFYTPADLFERAYKEKGDAARPAINELYANMPGERTPVARSRMKAY